jgi:hypothetical protein
MTPLELAKLEQGSEAWAQARCGLVTASRCADVIDCYKSGAKKGQETAARRDYRHELICEILTGVPYPQFVSREMQWGREQEPFARAAYEMARDVLVETAGFIVHPTIARFGASPDGLIGDAGMLQIKCPATFTHLSWLMGGVIPEEHLPQMLAELSCTGREWIDFVSFEPRLPEHLQLFIRRFSRNEKLIAGLETEVVHFNFEVDDVLKALPQKPQGIVLAMDRPNNDEVQF